jgi:dTDP-4-dehydrorhamnose 3,5-epimerase
MATPFKFEKTKLEGLIKISPFIAEDDRGLFIKDYALELFKSNGIDLELREVFYTESIKGVIRAIHFQEVKEQAKLVRVIKGKIFDIAVDLRKNSKTFGEWQGFYLSDENKEELYIPRGFGHGYLVIEDSIVSYKCDEKFYSQYDSGVMWNDPDINIDWPIDPADYKIIISDRDKKLQSFKEFRDKL